MQEEVKVSKDRVRKLSDPLLVEDSTFVKLAPALESILMTLDETATHHDHLVSLLMVLLTESGFRIFSTSDCSECLQSGQLYIPKDWKFELGVYQIKCVLQDVPEKCKLVAIPSGDTLILNFFSLTENKTIYKMAVQTLKYVNPFSSDFSGRYINCKEISHRFKDTLATPLRTDILTNAGLLNPSLLGLPLEIKYKILGMLNTRGLKRIAQCCHEFHELSNKISARRNLSTNTRRR